MRNMKGRHSSAFVFLCEHDFFCASFLLVLNLTFYGEFSSIWKNQIDGWPKMHVEVLVDILTIYIACNGLYQQSSDTASYSYECSQTGYKMGLEML